MVSTAQLTGIFVQIMIAFLLPIGLVVYFVLKKKMRWRSFVMGIIVFILFSQVLEKLLHLYMIDATGMRLKFTDNPYLFMLYGGLAAGLFEEFGRFFAFRYVLRKHHSYDDALSFGIGHAGIEVWLVTMLIGINTFVFAILMNKGMVDTMIGNAVPKETIDFIQQQLVQTPWWMYLVAVVERIVAILFHVSATLLVLYGVVRKQMMYVWLAVIYHACLDFAPALYQAGVLTNIWIVEGILMIFAVFAIYLIKRMKENFSLLSK